MKHKPVVFAAIGFALACLLSVPAAILLSGQWTSTELAKFGAVGDTFGVAAAVFAGAGSLAVFIVLYYDLQHRRGEYRPFVVMASKVATMTRARWVDDEFYFTARVTYDFSNATNLPALNLLVATADLNWSTHTAKRTSDRLDDTPLQAGANRECVIRFEFSGDVAKEAVRTLQRSEKLEIDLSVTYSGLNGSKWASKASYALKLEADADASLLGQALDKGSTEHVDHTDGIGGTPPVYLTLEAIPGTWSQDQLPD